MLNLSKNLDVLSRGQCRPKVSIKGFLSKNLDAMEYLLPLFDVPSLGLSRYQLSGANKLRIDSESEISCKGFSIQVPGAGDFKSIRGRAARWDNYVLSCGKNQMILNVALSLISYPKENLLNIKIFSEKSQKVKFYIGRGNFLPEKTMLIQSRWENFSEDFKLNPGLNNISLKIPMSKEDLFAYPTPFTKYIDGRNNPPYNAYHFIHIDGLYDLYEYSGKFLFKKYADLWSSYVDSWPKRKEFRRCRTWRIGDDGAGSS